jgi:DNA-binding LytR/AlgR family response regulator
MKTKVVVVDDDFSALKAIKNYCEQINLEVIAAFDSSKNFIDVFETLDFDLAILDYSMPQFDGLQVAALLNSKNIPIIFVTGHRDDIASKAWDLNCIDCIEKPVNPVKIKNAITKYSKIYTEQILSLKFKIYAGSILKVRINEIAAFTSCKDDKSKNDKTIILMTGDEYRITGMKIQDIIEMLPSKEFLQISRSNIISKNYAVKFTSNFEEIELNLGKKVFKLDIAPSHKEAFKAWI